MKTIDLKDEAFLELSGLLLSKLNELRQEFVDKDKKLEIFDLLLNKKINIFKEIYKFLTHRFNDNIINQKLNSSPEAISLFGDNLKSFIFFLNELGENIEIKTSGSWFQIAFGINNKEEHIVKNIRVNEEDISYKIDEKDYFSIVDDIHSVENGIILFFDALKEISKRLYVFCNEKKVKIDFKFPLSLNNIINHHDSIVIHYHAFNLMRDEVTAIFKNELELKNIFKKRVLRKKTGIDIPNINVSFSDAVAKILGVRFLKKYMLDNEGILIDSFIDVDEKDVADFFRKELNLINNYDNDTFINEFFIAYGFIDKKLNERYG